MRGIFCPRKEILKFPIYGLLLVLFTVLGGYVFVIRPTLGSDANAWSMPGGDPQRHSWSNVTTIANSDLSTFKMAWYKKIKPYIPNRSQLIIVDDTVYVSSSEGIFALDLLGNEKWVYPTEMPVGHSPTVVNDIVYFAGFDKMVHAISAVDGHDVWAFAGAKAGYDTNPLVVNNTVYIGSRDGNFYALDSSNGTLKWSYQTDGPISYSAAYDFNGTPENYNDDKVYFASNDAYAYALNPANGSLAWRSDKLPGDGFYSWWPVVVGNYVIFSGANNYVAWGGPQIHAELKKAFPVYNQSDPAEVRTAKKGAAPDCYDHVNDPNCKVLMRDINASEFLNFLDDDPNNNPARFGSPWFTAGQKNPRRSVFVLNRSNGEEDVISPTLWHGNSSGNRFPPIVDKAGAIYMTGAYSFSFSEASAQGRIFKWDPANPTIMRPVTSDTDVMDEPGAYVGMDNALLYVHHSDKYAKYFRLDNGSSANFYEITSNSSSFKFLIPDYNNNWMNYKYGNQPELDGDLVGGDRSGSHGDQDPFIPYVGSDGKKRIYVHRSNSIIVYEAGYNGAIAAKPEGVVEGNPNLVSSNIQMPIPSENELKQRLENEVQSMVDRGDLRPAYFVGVEHYVPEMRVNYAEWSHHYWHNPADTIYTLIKARPYLSASLQQEVDSYLTSQWSLYPLYTYTHKGWKNGLPRETYQVPGDVESYYTAGAGPNNTGNKGNYALSGANAGAGDFPGWDFDPYNLYVMWLYSNSGYMSASSMLSSMYSTSNPQRANILTLVQSAPPADSLLRVRQHVLNKYIAGYYGYLELVKATNGGNPPTSGSPYFTDYNNVNNWLNNQTTGLLAKKRGFINRTNYGPSVNQDLQYIPDTVDDYAQLSGVSLATMESSVTTHLSAGQVLYGSEAGGFLYMTPELGNYLYSNALNDTVSYIDKHEKAAPYWMMARAPEATRFHYTPTPSQRHIEGTTSHFYEYSATFQAKAYAAKLSCNELSKYIDAPAVAYGDLFYMQNIVAALDSTQDCQAEDGGSGGGQGGGGDNSPVISGVSTNISQYGSSVPKYEKFEITFDVQSFVANLNPYFEYDSSKPAGLEADAYKGITVNVRFTDPDGNQFIQPAFYYQDFEHTVASTDWIYPTASFKWKARLSPNKPGTWTYRIEAQDENVPSGPVVSGNYTVNVSSSTNSGPVVVSPNDGRYFQFENGAPFPGLGYNLTFGLLDRNDPVSENTPKFQLYEQNGIQFFRTWLSQWSIYGSAWNPWETLGDSTLSGRLRHNNAPPFYYTAAQGGPFVSTSVPQLSYPGSETFLWLSHGDSATNNLRPCTGIGVNNAKYSVKPSTTYRARVLFKPGDNFPAGLSANNPYTTESNHTIEGPNATASPYGFVVKTMTGNLFPNCYAPGGSVKGAWYKGGPSGPQTIGQLITTDVAGYNEYSEQGWWILEFNYTTTSTEDRLPRLIFALENLKPAPAGTTNGGSLIIDKVWFEESLGGSNYGPNVFSKQPTDGHRQIDQKHAFAFDKALELAADYDVYLKTVVMEKSDYTLGMFEAPQGSGQCEYDGCANNALISNGSDDFFGFPDQTRNPLKSGWLAQQWWRYLFARWGYSSNIHSWELINEGDPGSGRHYIMADELARYMHKNFLPNPNGPKHPSDHLVTTSFWNRYVTALWNNTSGNYPNIDYADVHQYMDEGNMNAGLSPEIPNIYSNSDFYDMVGIVDKLSSAAHGQSGGNFPNVRGELGMEFDGANIFTSPSNPVNNPAHANNNPPAQPPYPYGVWMHNYIWANIGSGGIYNLYWVDGAFGHQFDAGTEGGVFDHRKEFKPFYNFIKDVPVNNGHYVDIAASISGTDAANIRVLGQKDLTAGRAHLWIQNKKHTWCNTLGVFDGTNGCASAVAVTPVSGTVQLPGFQPNQLYNVQYWKTREGDINQQIESETTATSNSSGVITLTVDSLLTDKAVKLFDSSPANIAPVVDASADKNVIFPASVSIDATATDDGLPNPPAAITTSWSKVSGPGVVTFTAPSSVDTDASFSMVGSYVLRLTASDGELQSSDDLTVIVTNGVNSAPVVNPGSNQTLVFPATASLVGSVTDDGLPNPPAAVSVEWSKVSGPGTVSFGNANVLSTSASFSLAGTYVLRLTATDSQLTEQSDITITLNAPTNSAPVVDAGSDMSIALADTATLNATATDDGLPNPPAAITTTWSKQSGPGDVSFGNASAVDTTATFTLVGTYILRLTASDSVLSSFDEITVTVTSTPANNVKPNADAGPDQIVTLPDQVTLVGNVSDDGLPNPPGAVSLFWNLRSGPGTVTYTARTSTTTGVSFSLPGTYVLRLRASDGELQDVDDVTVTVNAAPPPVNQVPTINVGADQSITLPAGIVVSASTTDDGLPNPPASTTIEWSKQSGPGDVAFGSSSSPTTSVSFSEEGIYVLRGTVTDSELTAFDELTVSVSPAPPTNEAPQIEAGADQSVTLPDGITVTGAAADDDLPNPPAALSVQWSKDSGPGSVTFGTVSQLSSTVDFSIEGSYVLRLTVTDGELTSSDTLTVTVNPAPVQNQAPSVEAGNNQTITLPSIVNLNGTVSDDGLPNPPASFTSGWSKVSGPGSVTFGDASDVDTTAQFSSSGSYVLRLTANDSVLTASDTVTVLVHPQNDPPTVDAGGNQNITLPDTAFLNGTVSDDGLPNPPGAVSVEWTQLSGPATVAFANSGAVDTVATFTLPGSYVLRLTATDSSNTVSDTVTVNVQPENGAPVVNVGNDIVITLPAQVSLGAFVQDDGYPNPPAALTSTWSEVSGPGDVTFADAAAVDTTATFSAEGNYVLRLSVTDGELTSDDELVVSVLPPNDPPTVNAGADQSVTLPSGVQLNATADDDGLPNPPAALSVAWVKVTGTGSVTFSSPNSLSTSATFSEAGVYVLAVSVNDGGASVSDQLVVTVNPDPASQVNSAPSVDAGPNQTTTSLANVFLNGTIDDDGLPNPPSEVSVVWSKVSGPGDVSFQSAQEIDTYISFSLLGTYVLKLEASDGAASGSDTVSVTINQQVTAPSGGTTDGGSSGGTDDGGVGDGGSGVDTDGGTTDSGDDSSGDDGSGSDDGGKPIDEPVILPDGSKDTDGDGVSDFDEVEIYKTDIDSDDSDGDGLPDGWEVEHQLNPADSSDAVKDSDGDGLSNLEEFEYGLDPNNKSTNLIPDAWYASLSDEVRRALWYLLLLPLSALGTIEQIGVLSFLRRLFGI